MEIGQQEFSEELAFYKLLTEFRVPLFKTVLSQIRIPMNSHGLDAGCGIGTFTRMLAEETGEDGHVTGLDISKEFLRYSEQYNNTENLEYIHGDINELPFEDQVFDWIWSVDTVWPGPKELGCPSEEPMGIMNEFYRVLKPGGKMYILYWTSQKLLPGYPILEARLNTTSSATAPFHDRMDPLHHNMNARLWLESVGFKETLGNTFVHDINAPLKQNEIESLGFLFDLLWSAAEDELEEEDYVLFRRLCDIDSEESVLRNPDYYGFYTYTLFKGTKL